MSASNRQVRASRADIAQLLRTFDPKLSYRTLPDTRQVEITITVEEQWSAIAIEVVQFMDQFTRAVNRFAERGFREMRTDETMAALEAQYTVVRARYAALRLEGIKHRMAVYKLVEDRSLPFFGRWPYSEYNWCVRTRPTEPVIRPVPRSKAAGRKNSNES